MRIWIFIFSFTILLASCGFGKHLVYIDDWEGSYTLIEYNSCCDTATTLKLKINRKEINKYSWVMFGDKLIGDTLYGEAVYEKKQLKFFVTNNITASKYFMEPVTTQTPVFRIEYDNYYSDKEYRYINYYTRWYNELKDYKRWKMLFAGIDYHFKKENRNNSIKTPR